MTITLWHLSYCERGKRDPSKPQTCAVSCEKTVFMLHWMMLTERYSSLYGPTFKTKRCKELSLLLIDFIFRSQYKWLAVLAILWWILVWAFNYKVCRSIVACGRQIDQVQIAGHVYFHKKSSVMDLQRRDNACPSFLLALILRYLPLETNT